MHPCLMSFFLLCFVACAHSVSSQKLLFTSSLKDTARLGKGEAHFKMTPEILKEGLYMLGPAEGFQGEVTVDDGKLFHTEFIEDKLVTTHKPVSMVFNVYTQCSTFQVLNQSHLRTLESLEELLFNYSTQPRLVKFEGEARHIKGHVVYGIDKVQQRPQKEFFEFKKIAVKGIGVYSRNHRRIFTHHDSDVHFHGIMNGHTFHLDNFQDLKLQKLEVCQLKS